MRVIFKYIYTKREREDRERRQREKTEREDRERERDYVNVSQLFLPASGLDTIKNDETCHELIYAGFAKRKPPAVVADTGRKDD